MKTHYMVALYEKATGNFDAFCHFGEDSEGDPIVVTDSREEAVKTLNSMNSHPTHSKFYSYVLMEIEL